MKFHSLPEFLDKQNPALTAEGYPAPIRAVFVAEA
jgi:tRNA (mo5U34)-methyltransferase